MFRMTPNLSASLLVVALLSAGIAQSANAAEVEIERSRDGNTVSVEKIRRKRQRRIGNRSTRCNP